MTSLYAVELYVIATALVGTVLLRRASDRAWLVHLLGLGQGDRNRRRGHRVYAVRMHGWQLDYRPDGWLPLSVQAGRPHTPRWWVLPLGRLGCVTLGRLSRSTGSMTVTLEADTTAYDADMQKVARSLEEIRWQGQLRRERTAARRWWGEHITTAYARYGWDWPGPVQHGHPKGTRP